MADDLATQLAPFMGSPFDGSGEAFKRGTKAKNERGVAFFCPWDDPFAGFPEHARRNAMALDGAGLPVHLRSTAPNASWEGGPARTALRQRMMRLATNAPSAYIAQVFMVVPTLEAITSFVTHRHLDPEQLAGLNACKAIYTVWERKWIGPNYVRALNLVGQAWVAAQANADTLRECGVAEEKIRVVPCPFFPNDPLLKLRDQAKRKPGPPRFYHIGKWEPRKQHHRILGAFLQAFRPGEANFILKTSERAPKDLGDYPTSPDESIRRWMKHGAVKENGWTIGNVDQSVFLLKKNVPQSQITQLHAVGDCYVSLSQGEGFDMPAFDSKLAGNSLIYVPSGGPQDFAAPDDERVEPTGTERVHPFYNWEEGSTYLSYDLEDAIEPMRRMAARVRSEERAAPHDMSAFSAASVGAKMREYLEELAP